MAVRSLLLAAVVGIAAAGAFLPAAAQSRSSLSISVGTPYYGQGYNDGYGNRYGDQRHRPGYAWVPPHWVSTYRGRVWVPGQYVRAQGYGYGPRPGPAYGGYDGYDGYGRPGAQVIYRSGPGRVVPRSYYPPGYLSPYEQRRRRGW